MTFRRAGGVALFLAAVSFSSDCRSGEKPFPYSFPDASYPNGHPLVLNEADASLEAWEASIVDLTNQRRSGAGLGPLERRPMLDGLARAHSAHMVIHSFYAHVNPEGDGPSDRLIKISRSGALYENIWMVSMADSPEFIIEGFWNSPDHREAILSDSDWIGVGLYRSPNSQPTFPDLVHVTMEFLNSK